MPTPFVPDDFDVPLGLVTDRFWLEPLGPEHNERDHDAWMSSIDHIRATPGYPDGRWPMEMSAEQNLADLVRHAGDFAARRGFTYSLLDGDDVVGCVYLYPAGDGEHDVEVQSWVRAGRAELDVPLWEAVSAWLAEAWPFERAGVRAAPLSRRRGAVRGHFLPKPNRCWATLRIWISSAPSVIR